MQWRRNIKLIDANVILRYLLNEHAEMSLTARTLISSGNVYTKPEIISEVVYVLKRVYQIDKGNIKNFIHALLNDISPKIHAKK